MSKTYRRLRRSLAGLLVFSAPFAAQAAPAVPSGAHPRLFMSADELAGYTANAQSTGSVAAAKVKACQDTLDHPQDYAERGGVDGDTWPGAAVNCAFSYQATRNASHLAQAIKYWKAALGDDEKLDDHLGCTPGVSTDWQSWAQNGGDVRPPILLTVTHDTGYPIRWYGPDLALTYDWLYSAPGVDAGLLAQTRICLTNWLDWYSRYGYHHEEAGANYNAGFVIGKALGAIAIGNDGGADGHLWKEVVDDVFGKLLIGQGLAGANTGVGTPAGVLLGGDWAEGWQYGPLSVLEYAVAARAIERHGAPLPEMDAWTNSLVVRTIYGTVPKGGGQWPGGDFDSDQIYQSASANQLDAVLAGPSSEPAASFAAFEKQRQAPDRGSFIYSAFAELRKPNPIDFRAQTAPPPAWYLARGTRTLYARSGWEDDAYFAVFESAPQVVSDHHHFSASNFVLSRGGDHLLVDPSFYGCRSTLPTNAVTADSEKVIGSYAPSQTPWSQAELVWARASSAASGAVVAARSDFANAFRYADQPSDIPYARRDWVFLPEGEVVAVDRVHTADAAHKMYVNFHTNTGGTLKLTGALAQGSVGGSELAIHAVLLSGASPTIERPKVDDSCYEGSCNTVRFAVDAYSVRVPGPHAVAIHVLDALPHGESPALTGSLNQAPFDPAPQRNAGVIGAAVYRGSKQSYVVASSAPDGASAAALSYAVPGTPARHIVFDAPEASDGTSKVTAAVDGDRCALTITAGAGKGFTGHPLMFQVDPVSAGCAVVESTDVASGAPPLGGGAAPLGGTGGGTSANTGGTTSGDGANGGTTSGGAANAGTTNARTDSGSGCGCRTASGGERGGQTFALFALFALFLASRRRRRVRTFPGMHGECAGL